MVELFYRGDAYRLFIGALDNRSPFKAPVPPRGDKATATFHSKLQELALLMPSSAVIHFVSEPVRPVNWRRGGFKRPLRSRG